MFEHCDLNFIWNLFLGPEASGLKIKKHVIEKKISAKCLCTYCRWVDVIVI
jgi:hypothetical protein